MQIRLLLTFISFCVINSLSSQAITYTQNVTHSLCNGVNNGSIEITITSTNAPYTFLWDNGDTDNSVTDLAPGNYSVTITDNLLNTLTITITIEELACNFNAEIYFTPNGDGVNDKWYISNTLEHPDLLVIVYNRAGQKVFESKGQYSGWDGRDIFGALLPDETYYYVIFSHKKSTKPAAKGSVSILK